MGNHRDIIKNVSDQPLENPLTRASRELFQTCLELGSVTSASLAAHLGIDEESVASRFKRAKNQIQDMYPEAADIHDRTAMLFLSLNAGWVSFVPKPPRLTRGGEWRKIEDAKNSEKCPCLGLYILLLPLYIEAVRKR